MAPVPAIGPPLVLRTGGSTQNMSGWTSGNPGIGFYDNPDSNWKDFGFSSFSASDGSNSGNHQQNR